MQYRMLALIIAVAITPATAAEESRTTLGTLAKSPEAEARNMTCGFKPASSRAEQKYTGSLHGLAQDAVMGKLVLVWTVIGSADATLPDGQLAQRYVKAVGVASQPPLLVGEANPVIALQFETNGGAETNGSITQVELKRAGIAA